MLQMPQLVPQWTAPWIKVDRQQMLVTKARMMVLVRKWLMRIPAQLIRQPGWGDHDF
jgi:hypothetical protein